MQGDRILLARAETAEGLRLERVYAAAHDQLHAAENDLQRYMAHLAALHEAPEGWKIYDWMRGFEPVAEQVGDLNGRRND